MRTPVGLVDDPNAKCWRDSTHVGPFTRAAFVETPTRFAFYLCGACRREFGGEIVECQP